MSSYPSIDAGIPVLTEIITNVPVDEIPAPEPVALEPVAPAAAPVAAQEEAVTDAPVITGTTWDKERWEQLECEVRERVLRQVLDRIDFVLEQRVRDSLADVLQTAVENLANEIKGGLHHAIKDVVTRAVTQEITKLQSTNR